LVLLTVALDASWNLVAGWNMSCNKCASSNQRGFTGELTVSFSELENINLAPVRISQDVLVCRDRGRIELILPAAKVEQLKRGSFVLFR
jgi:hypothetical protein